MSIVQEKYSIVNQTIYLLPLLRILYQLSKVDHKARQAHPDALNAIQELPIILRELPAEHAGKIVHNLARKYWYIEPRQGDFDLYDNARTVFINTLPKLETILDITEAWNPILKIAFDRNYGCNQIIDTVQSKMGSNKNPRQFAP